MKHETQSLIVLDGLAYWAYWGLFFEKMHRHLYQQEIDFRNECIKLSSTTPTELKDLPKRIPKDAARYHFFLYKHSHEGDYLESTGKDNTLKHYEKILRHVFFNTLILYHTIIFLAWSTLIHNCIMLIKCNNNVIRWYFKVVSCVCCSVHLLHAGV